MTLTFQRPASSTDDHAYVYLYIKDHGSTAEPYVISMVTRIVNWSAYPCEQRPDATICPIH